MYVALLNWIRCPIAILLGIAVAIVARDANGQAAWGDGSYQSEYSGWQNNFPEGGGFASSGQSRAWTLGANGDNTNAGFLVRQVRPNSAADRANISPGDAIVCVAGDQVGRVGNRIFSLNEKLNGHADSRGRVLLLVNYRQRGELRPVNITLQNRSAGLTGSLVIRNGRLPSDAVVTVRLENVSRPHFIVRNGETSFRSSGYDVGNIPFQLDYDPRYISNNNTYRVRAFVTSRGRTIFDTFRPPTVITQGNPTSVRLVLRPTSYRGPRTESVVNVGYSPVNEYSNVRTAYEEHLGRPPTSMEMAAWQGSSDFEGRMESALIGLMSTQEYFNRVGGNNTSWLRTVFTKIIGHRPSTTEMQLWERRFRELGFSRAELLNQLSMQAR